MGRTSSLSGGSEAAAMTCGPCPRLFGYASAGRCGAQTGGKAGWAEPLKGLGGAGVLEVVDDHDGETYRAVYTVRFAGVVYVLHAFQKKSKHGIATPKHEIALIEQRLKRAREDHEQWRASRTT